MKLIEIKKSICVPPGETIKETFDYYGYSDEQAAKSLNLSLERYTNIINGDEVLSSDTIQLIEDTIGLPSNFLANLQRNYISSFLNLRFTGSDFIQIIMELVETIKENYPKFIQFDISFSNKIVAKCNSLWSYESACMMFTNRGAAYLNFIAIYPDDTPYSTIIDIVWTGKYITFVIMIFNASTCEWCKSSLICYNTNA